MKINQYEIWLAELNEAGKTRPVLIIQTDLLNNLPHVSTIICPLTTNVKKNAKLLRVHLESEMTNLQKPCDIMIDLIRAIDSRRLIKKIGDIPDDEIEQVKYNLKIILDLH